MNTSSLFPEDINVEIYHREQRVPVFMKRKHLSMDADKAGGSYEYLLDFPIIIDEFGNALDDLAHALHAFNTLYHDEKLMVQLFSLHSRFKVGFTLF